MSLTMAKHYARNKDFEKAIYELCKEIDDLDYEVSNLKRK